MSLASTVFGTPPTTSYNSTAATRPPGYGFAQSFFNSLQNIASNPFPQYGGKLDPGLSPTLQDLIQRSQGYAASSPPSILQGAAGTYGRLMNPNLQNPITRIFGGAPDYTGLLNPNQKVYGGGTAGSMTFPGSFTTAGMQPSPNYGPQQQPFSMGPAPGGAAVYGSGQGAPGGMGGLPPNFLQSLSSLLGMFSQQPQQIQGY